MTLYYRLIENWGEWDEGICITENQYKGLYYIDKPLFEAVTDLDSMFKFFDEKYCSEKGVEFLLFYSENNLNHFLNKKIDNGFAD